LLVTESSDTITKIEIDNREIIIIGTAHVSKESAEEVSKTIREEKPDNVCVEIDAVRYNSLQSPNSWQNLDIFKVIKNKQGVLLLANLALSSFQKKIGKSLDVKPGEEMKAAIDAAQAEGIPFTFADRDIQVTLKRAWAKSSLWGKNKLFAVLFSNVFFNEKISDADIENMKKKSELDGMMSELANFLPSIKEVLIDERDKFLASKIYNADGKKIVAVVGAGHVPGIVSWIEKFDTKEDTNIDSINVIPKPKKIMKILPWIIPAAVIAIICTGFFRSGLDKSLDMMMWWVIINGSLAALGALIALAHPLTIISAFIAAPFTTMNPTIGVGMVTGLLEAVLRKPKVADFENLSDDITSLKGFWKNRITHILLVFFLSSIGSIIGTFVAVPYITSLLS
jgi:pheromone shutdown-related protein TraB